MKQAARMGSLFHFIAGLSQVNHRDLNRWFESKTLRTEALKVKTGVISGQRDKTPE